MVSLRLVRSQPKVSLAGTHILRIHLTPSTKFVAGIVSSWQNTIFAGDRKIGRVWLTAMGSEPHVKGLTLNVECTCVNVSKARHAQRSEQNRVRAIAHGYIPLRDSRRRLAGSRSPGCPSRMTAQGNLGPLAHCSDHFRRHAITPSTPGHTILQRTESVGENNSEPEILLSPGSYASTAAGSANRPQSLFQCHCAPTGRPLGQIRPATACPITAKRRLRARCRKMRASKRLQAGIVASGYVTRSQFHGSSG